eukprot:18165-Pelagomonas_calceolata.AAC.6
MVFRAGHTSARRNAAVAGARCKVCLPQMQTVACKPSQNAVIEVSQQTFLLTKAVIEKEDVSS